VGKFKLSLVAIFLISLNAFAQQPPTQGAYFDQGSVGTIYKVGRYIGGQLVFTPSLLTDNGTQLLYNGLPVGGGSGGGVSSVGATNTALFNLNVSNPTTTPLITPTLNNQPTGTFYGNFSGASAAPIFNLANTLSPGFIATNMTAFPTGQFAASALVSPITSSLIGEYHYNEASGATVGVDYSGHGNNGAYFGTPTLTGTLKGGMTSAGVGGMDLPTTFNTTGLTIANYICTDASTTLASYATVVAGLASSTAPTLTNPQMFGMMLQGTQGSTPLGLSFGKYGLSPTIVNQTSVSAAQISTQSGETLNSCHLATWSRGASKDQFYIDDHEVSFYQYQLTGSAATVPASGGFSVGMPHYATLPQVAYASPYPTYYTFVFNAQLTLDQIKALSGSVAGAATFRGITKGKGTFSDAGNQLLAVGDSITYGLQASNIGWPSYLTGLNNPYIVTNISTPGWQLQNIITECETRGWGSFNPNSNTTVVIMAGTNDLLQTGGALGTTTPAIAYQRLRRAVQCYKGLKPQPRVVVMTMMSRGTTGNVVVPANDVIKNTYNDLIRRDNAGADLMFDVAAFAGFGADGAVANPTLVCSGAAACFGTDGVHPTLAGQTTFGANFSQFLNWADSLKNGVNPKQVTTATATIAAGDVAIAAVPSAAQTLTLPSAVSLVGTDRYINNTQSANTVTIAAAAGENIDGASTLVCPSNTKCALRSVLGVTAGLPTADGTAGAHWEQFGFSGGGGGGSGNATSIQGIAVSATAPTNGQILAYSSGTTSYAPATVSGTVIGNASNTALGIVQCDGTTTTCSGAGIISVIGGGGGVSSFNTRTGAVVPTTGDYTAAQVTNAADKTAANTFSGILTAPTFNYTSTLTKSNQGVHPVNGCAAVSTTAGTFTYTCSITGGQSANACWTSPTNAAASLLMRGVQGTSVGNIPFVTISGTTATLTFLTTTTGVQSVAGSETFSVVCDI
jgi:lysophospholipase L1-like esterase